MAKILSRGGYALWLSIAWGAIGGNALAQDNLQSLGNADQSAAETQTTNLDDPQAENPAQLTSSGPKLDEIIVTAQKRAEDVQDVPISVTAISEETLDLKNIEGIGALQLVAPNVSITSGSFFNFIYVRGMGSDLNLGFDSSVGMFMDNVHLGRRAFLDQDLLDVGRVELLRGPQGALFGKNTIAGALALYTNDVTFEWEGDFSYKRGFKHFSEEDERYSATLNVPIWEDHIGVRGAWTRHTQPGFMYNTKLNRPEPVAEDEFWRYKARYRVNDDIDMSLSYDWSHVKLEGSGSQITVLPDHWLALFQLFDPEAEGNGFDTTTSKDGLDTSDRETKLAILNVNWELGDFLITSTTGWGTVDEAQYLDVDFSPLPLLELYSQEDYTQWSQEVRLTSPEARFQYVTGLFYFWSEFDSVQSTPIGGMDDITATALGLGVIPAALSAALTPLTDILPALDLSDGGDSRINKIRQETISMSAFFEANYEITPALIGTVGLRLNREEKNAVQQLEHANGGALFFAINQDEQAYQLDDSRVEYHFAPRLALSWHVDEEQMFYFTATKGTKSGGFNASALNENQTRFEDEVSYGLETGYRSEWFNGAARFNVSVFHSVFNNLQVSAFNGTQFVVTNAADAISQGIELEGALALSENLFLAGAYGLLRAYYDKFENGPCPAGGGDSCDLSGRRLASAPRDSGNIALFYDYPMGDLGFNLHFSIEGFYQGTTFFQTDLDPVDSRGPTWLWNGRLGVMDEDRNWWVMIFTNNITAEGGIVGSSDVPVLTGAHFGGGGGGRTYVMEARFRF